MQWHTGSSYLMNQRTFALLHTMSDAIGRPLLSPIPQGPGFVLDGSPIKIASQMPDAAAGATPVAFATGKPRIRRLIAARQRWSLTRIQAAGRRVGAWGCQAARRRDGRGRRG